MDPYSFNINSTSELRLRRHIREVLLPYARMHLTSNHVAFTENIVEELLLQTLEYVPMADATSFLLPTDPFELFMRSFECLDLTPPDEKWTTPSQHVRYLRTFFPPPPNPQDLWSEKCWYEDDHYAKLSLIYKPISTPVLSRRARLQTPKVGSTNSRASIPRTKSALKTYPGLNAVSDERIEDPPTPAMDDVLCLRLEIDSTTRTKARQFIQSDLIPLGNVKSIDHRERTPNVPKFLSRDSPPRCLPSLDSPPLFSRIVCGHSARKNPSSNVEKSVENPTGVPDLVHMLKVASPELIDGEDGDINHHHMKAVSGWATMKYSSPPPPSRQSSDRSEVDELWDMSPPGTPATSLVAAKMDEIEIPRIRKFGYKNTSADESTNSCVTDLLKVVKSPGFFITSFISAPVLMTQTQKPITSQLNGAKSGMLHPHPLSPGQATSNSLLEQPPSAAEEQPNEEPLLGCAGVVEDFEEERLDDAVANIYVSTSQDPISYIREEKLDDKDIMLMDVPNLPPPTAHLRELVLFPEGMQSFVAPKAKLGRPDITNRGGYGLSLTGFLKPVKGIKPLALDLSWRPFNFGKTIPTDEEVAGIAQPIQSADEAVYHDEKYTKTIRFLFDLAISPSSAEIAHPILIPKSPRGCEGFGMSPTPKRAEFESGHVEYLLTQRERNRALGANTENGVQTKAGTEELITPSTPHDDQEVAPEKNYSFQEAVQPDSQNPLDLMECVSGSQTDDGFFFDVSGLDVMDNNLNICQFSTNEFGIPHSLLAPPSDNFVYDVDAFEANKENIDIDHPSENKEDVPPVDADDYQLGEHQNDPLTEQLDWSDYLQFPESHTTSFESLLFASQSRLPTPSHDFTNLKEKAIPAPAPNARGANYNKDDLVSTSECRGTTSRATKRRKLNDLVPASSLDLFSTFIGLRNKATLNLTLQESEIRTDAPVPVQIPDAPEQSPLPRVTPDDVFDQRTVRLPEHWVPAAVVHRYFASMALIQKRALVQDLQGPLCRIVLIERYDLGGTDVIIDPDYGVLFIPLLALPAHVDSAMERISHESWRYSNLLIVFEAYPSAQSYRADRSHNTRSVPYAYTPPICKAIRKLRRNMGISEGCGTLDPRCTLRWAFANDVAEAAKFVRCFGEEACAMSSERGQGGLWDQREWLEKEEREGESDLAAVHGMNVFAAFIMLYDSSLEAILEMSPEARLANFGPLLGQERMMGLNALIKSRMQQIAPDAADSVIDPGH
ncbi:hypothetical protein JVU11DRAFT_4759 [Chiua virens]|nr:hypothetical protein JVU11DRAFT_4759 [Chiua virens]